MDVTDLTEPQADLLNRLVEQYPGALGYHVDRDEPVRALAAPLIDAGYVERVVVEQGVSYRLTDQTAEDLRHRSAEQGESARWN